MQCRLRRKESEGVCERERERQREDHPASVPVRALDGRLIRLEASGWLICRSRCSCSPLPSSAARRREHISALTRVGESPPPTHTHSSISFSFFFFFIFYNGYLQGASLGVPRPGLAGRLSGIAVSNTAHVSIALNNPIKSSRCCARTLCVQRPSVFYFLFLFFK